MLKRRGSPRFVVANGDGILRVAQDVTLTSTAGELVTISAEPLAVSDAVMIEAVIDGQVARLPVRVEQTKPVIVDGEIRHEITLSFVDPNGK